MRNGWRLAFRTTGGAESGLGHVRRCLALAQALRALGADSLFLLDGDRLNGEPAARDHVAAAGFVHSQVAAAGFQAATIRLDHDLADTIHACRSHGADAVVVDTYAVTTDYFRGLAETGISIGDEMLDRVQFPPAVVVIDDLADRELPVDLVVNGSAGAERLVYRGAPHTRYLLGPSYIPLRPEFAEPPARVVATTVERVLITLGGSDPDGLAARLVRWTAKTLDGVRQDVVVGPYFRGLDALREEARAFDTVVLHQDPPDMGRLMLGADLAICGGGQTTYELAATGTPAVAILMAGNQIVNLTALAEAGALVWVGAASDVDLESRLTDALTALAADPRPREEMSRRGRALVDGQGAARVARAVVTLVRDRG